MLLDLLFPRTCVGCDRIGVYVCSQCLNKVRTQDKYICPVCAKPGIFGRTHPRCLRPRSLDGLWAGFAYRGLVQDLIGKYKYKYVYDTTQTLVELVISLPDWSGLPNKDWLIVPVPLHRARLRERGFNQSVLLGRELSKYLDCFFSDQLLTRSKKTTPQMQLTRKERLTNLTGAFKYTGPQGLLKGVDVLLVDDVWTTGSTLRECAKVLKRSGAKTVWGFVVAR